VGYSRRSRKEKGGGEKGTEVTGQHPFKQAWWGQRKVRGRWEVATRQQGGGGGPDTAAGGSERPVASHGQRAGAGGAQSCETLDAGALMGGPRALCRVLNRFKPSKSIQTHSNLF
jgi:hypothetical protein